MDAKILPPQDIQELSPPPAYEAEAPFALDSRLDRVTPPSSGKKRFRLLNKAFSRNYHIIVGDGETHKGKTPIFVIDVSVWTPAKPDITLHKGADHGPSSPAVACAYIPSVTRTYHVGLGDAVNAKEMVRWEEMRQCSFWSSSRFSWTMDLPSGERPELMWKRTGHVAVDSKTVSSLSTRNWKLVNVTGIVPDKDGNKSGGDVVAVFTCSNSLSLVCGTLQINVDWGNGFDYMVLTTVVALWEKAKRDSQSSSGGGGG